MAFPRDPRQPFNFWTAAEMEEGLRLATRNAGALRRQCEAFNLLHPVGSTVRCWKGERGDGPGYVGQVREPGAYVLSGHTAVVFVTGVSGCIALTHVEGAQD